MCMFKVTYTESLKEASEYDKPLRAGSDSSFYFHKGLWSHMPRG